MKPDNEEIAGMLAKAKQFCASIPDGDNRRHFVPPMKLLCEGIATEIALARLTGQTEPYRTASGARLAIMLGKVRELLYQADGFEMARELGRAHQQRKKTSAKGSKAGGDATKIKFAKPDLDDLLRGFLARNEKPPVKSLAVDYAVSRQTIYNAIDRIKTKS